VNTIRISKKGDGQLPYQLVGSFWVPWKGSVAEPKKELEIAVDYDRTRRLKAKYPVRAKVPPSRVYEYYNPQNGASTRPVEILVDPR